MSAALAPERILARHGKTFHWASRLLGARHASRAARLYAFLRAADDLVDEQGGGRAELALFRHRAWYEDGLDESCFDARALDPFFDALARDAGPVRIADHADLLRYCYGVAGTVGLHMCRVLDVTDARAHPFAIDLGIGMQLTNIARDVLEDAKRDRVYLPRTLLGDRADAAAIREGNPRAGRRAEQAIRSLLELATRYYRSADAGMHFLPARARLGILVASRGYEAIGARVLDALDNQTYWGRRAFVTPFGKSIQTWRAAQSYLGTFGWRSAVHDPALHDEIRDLPGADRGRRAALR